MITARSFTVPFLLGIIFGGAGTFLVVYAFFHSAYH